LNQTLRDMSGAAITPQEADRLRRAIPDPDTDSPTEFATKYNDVVGSLRNAHQRYLGQLGVQGQPPQAPPQVLEPGAEAAPEKPGADATFEDLVDFYSQGGRF
jgi:hypothetical protein